MFDEPCPRIGSTFCAGKIRPAIFERRIQAIPVMVAIYPPVGPVRLPVPLDQHRIRLHFVDTTSHQVQESLLLHNKVCRTYCCAVALKIKTAHHKNMMGASARINIRLHIVCRIRCSSFEDNVMSSATLIYPHASRLPQRIGPMLFGLLPDRAFLKPIVWLCQVLTRKASFSDAFSITRYQNGFVKDISVAWYQPMGPAMYIFCSPRCTFNRIT